MWNVDRRLAYTSLWVLALAFGWIEASIVVYLRELYTREMFVQGGAFPGFQVTLVTLPNNLVALEMAREACTIVLLGAAAWLAGRGTVDRAGAFLILFGVWDLAYYGVLKLIASWPESLSTWDILFLIPAPWVAPVWTPMLVATLFIAAGTILFSTPERDRRYRWTDIAALGVSALLIIGAFLVESSAAIDHRVPERFPVWLFLAGVALGSGCFLRVEGRGLRRPSVVHQSG